MAMKRSEINQLVNDATALFQHHGLVLVNLADEPEYCEKLMYAKEGMTTPAHCHARKTEDIISRNGVLRIQLWAGKPESSVGKPVKVKLNGVPHEVVSGSFVDLHSGWRIKIVPGVYHEYPPLT